MYAESLIKLQTGQLLLINYTPLAKISINKIHLNYLFCFFHFAYNFSLYICSKIHRVAKSYRFLFAISVTFMYI